MKKIAFVFLLLLIFFPLASQTTGTDSVTESDLVTASPFEKSFFEATDFFVGFTPLAYISTENDNKGGPSSIVYPLYFGIAWPRDYWISIQPSLKIFTDYYLVSEGKVYPAEIENRTGLGFSFLLNVPVVFQANFWDKSNLKLSAGIALLFRFAVTAPGIDSNEAGDSGKVSDDISLINSSFYEGAKFIYFSTSADWMFTLNNGMQIGPEISFYIPVITLASEFSLNGTMISCGVKLFF